MQQKVSFFQSIANFWKGYIDFAGSAMRSEFWQATLFLGILLVCSVVLSLKLALCVSIVCLLPSLALLCRRFRDVGFYWWLLVVNLVVSAILSGMFFYLYSYYWLIIAPCVIYNECGVVASVILSFGPYVFYVLGGATILLSVLNIIICCLPTGWKKRI